MSVIILQRNKINSPDGPFWRARCAGYTHDLDEAYRYTIDKARRYSGIYRGVTFMTEEEIMADEELVLAMALRAVE